MANIIVEKASEFDETLREYFVKHAGDTVLVYLYGNVQPHTGKSWCPDCAAADEPIRAAAAEAGMTLVEVPVGERHEYKGVPTNPYRVHPQIKLVSVPTIIKWTKAGPGGRLVERECRSQADIAAFLAK